MLELIVTNFNRNFTGVSATAAGVVRQQVGRYDMALAGVALPGCPNPISKREATHLSRTPPPGRAFTLWHVRRNTEMRAALWARDILRLPVKIVFTSAAIRRHSAFPRWLISRMDAVIATTEAAAGFVPACARNVVPHGVDTERLSPAEDRTAAWVATGYPGSARHRHNRTHPPRERQRSLRRNDAAAPARSARIPRLSSSAAPDGRTRDFSTA